MDNKNRTLSNGVNNDEYNEIVKREQLHSLLEFNETIIQERNEEIQKIHKEVLDINEIFKDLNKLVNEQNSPINTLEGNISKSVEDVKESVNLLHKANEYHSSWMSNRNKLILMSIAGLSVNVPITVFLGLKAGVISGISTIGLSALTTLFSRK